MVRKINFFLFLAIFLISIGSSYSPHKLGSELQFSFADDNAGDWCNVTSIEKYNPSQVAVVNIPSTKIGSNYNFTIAAGNFSDLGDVCLWIKCESGTGSVCRTISSRGIVQSTSQGINSAVFLFLMLGLTCLIGFLGFKFMQGEYLWVLGLFFIFLMFLFLVYDVWLGYEYHSTLTGINDGSGMPETIFWIFLFILVSSLVVSGILLFKYWKKIKEWFIRGKEEYEQERQEDARNWR